MAIRTVSVAGGNYNNTATWVELVVPTSADDVVFTAISGNLTVNVPSVAKTFICTTYVGTLTMSSTLTVSGSVTFVAGMTIAGLSDFIVNAAATITSNGKSLTGGLQLISATFTLVGGLTVAGTVTTTGNVFVNDASITASSDLTVNGGLYGNQPLILNGTGIWSGGGDNTIAITINTVGTITISGTVLHRFGVLTYTAGTVVTTSSTLRITGAATLNTNGIIWNNLIVTENTTTLNSALTVRGDITVNGIISSNTILLNGTGTWVGTGVILSSININTPGTLTVSGTVNYRGGTLTYTAGTVITTGSSLDIESATTLNTNGIIWNNVNLKGATITLNSLLTVNNTLTVGSLFDLTLAGTHGFTCNTFVCNVSGRLIDFAVNKTYTVTNSLVVTGTTASKITFRCLTAYALFNLQVGANQNVENCNATNIDSSGGQTIYTSDGTLTNTINWFILPTTGFITFFMS